MDIVLLSPVYSFLVRGAALSIVLLLALSIFFGIFPYIYEDVFTYFSRTTGIMSARYAEILEYIVPLLLFALSSTYFVFRERLGLAVLKTIGFIALSLLVITIVFYGIGFTYSAITGQLDSSALIVILGSLILLLTLYVLTVKYPMTALTITVIDEDGNEKLVLGEKQYVVLSGGAHLRIKIYGGKIRVNARPYDAFYISENKRTITHEFIDIKPRSAVPGEINVFYEDNLIYSVKIKLEDIQLKKINFRIYYNDDQILEREYSVEALKTVLQAARPAISAALARLGIDENDIKEIQFFTEDGINVPGDAYISDLKDVDTLEVRLYTVEKHLELLRYYRKSDVFKLWETLIKRLERFSEDVNRIDELLSRVVSELTAISQNWW